MNFKIRNLKEKEYVVLCEYWKFWRFSAPSREMLPNDFRYSIAVIYKEEIVCTGFLYVTPSAFAFCEYIVSNPKIRDKNIRKEALLLLINSISELAKKMGFKLLFTSLNNQNLVKHYLDCGYIKGSTSIEMIKKL